MKTLVALLLAAFAGVAQSADNSRFFPLAIEEVGGKPLASYGPEHPWSSIPKGSVEFDRVPFNIVNKVQVHGNGDAKDNRLYPTRLTGIRVGQRTTRVHLVHGGNMSDRDGRPVVSLHFHFSDGRALTNHLAYGVHFRDWWKHRVEPLESITDPGSKQVWTGRSIDADKQGSTHRLFKTTIDLPPTDKLLESIDIYSLFSRGSYIVVGMTAEMAAAGIPATKPAPPADDSRYRDEILLHVTDHANNPLPGARIRGTAQSGEAQPITLGRTEDGESKPGVVVIDIPAGTRELRLTVGAARFASAELNLNRGEDGRLPREASAALDPGTRIGGVVRAQDGRPLPKAKVEVSGLKADLAGQAVAIRYDEVTTDPAGNWKTESVPENFADLSFHVTCAEFRPGEFELSEDGADGTVKRAALLGRAAEFILKPGIAIAGVVRDDAGKPATGVELTLAHGEAQKKTIRALTDGQGRFGFVVLEEGTASLLAEKSGFAPTLHMLDVFEGLLPVQLALTHGRTLKGRVLEMKPPALTDRTPAPGVDVMITSSESPLLRWSTRTDAAGRFEWPNAPSADLRIAAGRGGPDAETFLPSKSDDVEIVLQSEVLAMGTVVDAETRQPIPEFTVTPGQSWSEDRVDWLSNEAVRARDGAFALAATSRNRGRSSVPVLLKVEAPGYWPQSIRVRDTDVANIALQLRRGSNPKGVAKLSLGQPAAGAEVAIVGDGYLELGKGRFNSERAGGPERVVMRSDAEGRFELPLRLSQRVVIVHPDGYGETTLSNLADQAEVKLQPWGTVEGVVMVGNKPAANAEVKLNENKNADGLQYGYDVFDLKTDAEGRFRFTHVPPGPRWLVRLVPTRSSSRAWSHQTPVTVVAGKVAQVTVGGTGRPVIGKVVSNDPSREIEWNSGHHSFGTVQPRPPRFSSSEDYRAWASSAEVKAAREAFRYYAVVFAGDGSFRVDDVPTGNYELRLFFNEPEDATRPGSQGKPIGNITRPVEIGPLPNDRSDEPLDLGTLELKVRE